MQIAPLIVAVPLLAAAGLIAVATGVRRWQADAVALTAALVAATFCSILLGRTAGGLEVYWFGGWEPRSGIAIGISFSVDAFGAGLATLVAVLMVVAMVVMWRYRDTDAPHFQVLMLLFLAGMTGFCLSGDLFNMFVFFELMSVSAFALAGYKIDEEEAVEGSLNFAITNTIGSFLLLTGIALVYGRTGALNLGQIGTSLANSPHDGLLVVAFVLLVAGFLVKAAAVPFHFWLADAYAVAPTPVCILFAGAMSELGVYAVGRIWFDSFAPALGAHADGLGLVLIVAGSLTALLGAAMSFAQDHLKRMLAFATISYVGVFLIGLGLLTPVGLAGAAIYVVADGFGKAALFGAVAVVQHRCGRVSALVLRGSGRALRFTGLVFLLGALSFAAVPPFGTFLGKSMIEDELIGQGYGAVLVVLVLGSALTSAAVLRAAGRVFLGWGDGEGQAPARVDEEGSEEKAPLSRTPSTIFIPAAALVLAALGIGLIPGIGDAVEAAAARFMAGPDYAHAVLAGGSPPPVRPPAPYSVPLHSYLYSALTLLLTLGFAAAALFGRELGGRRVAVAGAVGGHLIEPLRRLHSGHIGDYVAWLVAGVAALGGALVLALT